MRSKRSFRRVSLVVTAVTGAVLLSGAFALYGGRGVEAASPRSSPQAASARNAAATHPRHAGLRLGAIDLRLSPTVRLTHASGFRRNAEGRSSSPLRTDGPIGAEVAGQPTLKYLASGWWTTTADVDCSGSSCQFSVRQTPMRLGSSSVKIFS